MRVLLSIGYQKLLLGNVDDVGRVLQGLDGAQVVEQDGYGAEMRYIVKEEPLEVTIIADGSVVLPESPKDAAVDRLLKIKEENGKLQTEVYDLKAKLKKFTDAAQESK